MSESESGRIYCCDDMCDAQEVFMDYECYSFAVWPRRSDGRLCIQSDAPPLNYCPWCGEPLRRTENE